MSSSNNLFFSETSLSKYYANHRFCWNKFYPSERKVIQWIKPDDQTKILDIGCACGGLGFALLKRFGSSMYSGVEMNKKCIEIAKNKVPWGRFLQGDFLALNKKKFLLRPYHLVVSLSGIDWNIEFSKMLKKSWELVQPGGYLLLSVRLTTGASTEEISKSYQFVRFDGKKIGQKAPYRVLNGSYFGTLLRGLKPQRLLAYGFWGKPSPSAATPFFRVCFCVFGIQKTSPKTTNLRKKNIIRLPANINTLLAKGFHKS